MFINNLVLVGRVHSMPEWQDIGGHKAAKFLLVVQYENVKKEAIDHVFEIINWHKQAEWVMQEAKLGEVISVEGSLSSRAYQNRNGQIAYFYGINCRKIQFANKAFIHGRDLDTSRKEDALAKREEKQDEAKAFEEDLF